MPRVSLHFKRADREDRKETGHPVFFLWSRAKPNLHANLEALESDDRVRPALLQELANFEGQLAKQRKILDGCKAVFHSAMRTRRRAFNTDEWFDLQMRKHGLRFQGWELDEPASKGLHHEPRWDSLSISELRGMAERKRAELKETMARVIVTRSAAFAACRFASERPLFARNSWVALCSYWGVPRSQLSRKKVREGLKTLGLQAERIEEECRFRETTCFIRDSDGKLEIHERDVS